MSSIDKTTGANVVMLYAHHELHEGDMWSCFYSVASIGAMTTPDDAIQLTWTTPKGPGLMHLVIHAQCGGPALYKFTEGWTGAGVSPTGTITGYNRRRDRENSNIIMYYDATLVTGGVVLEQEYISTGKFGAGESRSSQEWILNQNTKYAVSLYLNDAQIATIKIDWYFHKDRK